MLANRIPVSCVNYTAREEVRIGRMINSIKTHSLQIVEKQRYMLNMTTQRVKAAVPNILSKERRRIELAEAKAKTADPQTMLRLGFSITRVNGQVITDIGDINAGDCIETTLANGTVISTVKHVNVQSG